MTEPEQLELDQAPDTELPEHLKFLESPEPEAEVSAGEAGAEAEVSEDEDHDLPKGLRKELADLRTDRRHQREINERMLQQIEGMRQYFIQQSQRAAQAEYQPDPKLDPDSPEYDPAARILRGVEERTAPVIRRLEQLEGNVTQQQMSALVGEFYREVGADVDTFRSQHEDYDNALEHWRGAVSGYLRSQGIPEETIPAAVDQQEKLFAYQAKRNNRNPAQVLYEYVQTIGYQPANGATSLPPQTGRAAQIQQGVKTAKPTGGRSAKAGGGMNYEQFLTLPQAEQNKIASDPELWEDLFTR